MYYSPVAINVSKMLNVVLCLLCLPVHWWPGISASQLLSGSESGSVFRSRFIHHPASAAPPYYSSKFPISLSSHINRKQITHGQVHIAHFHIISSLEAQVEQDKDIGRGITQRDRSPITLPGRNYGLWFSLPIQHCYTAVGCWNLFCFVICWVCQWQCSVQGCRVYSITHPSWVTVLHCDNELIQNQNILNKQRFTVWKYISVQGTTQNENVVGWVMSIKIRLILTNEK